MENGSTLALIATGLLVAAGAVASRRRGSRVPRPDDSWQRRRESRWFAIGERQDQEFFQGRDGDSAAEGFEREHGVPPYTMISYDPMKGACTVEASSQCGTDLYDGWGPDQQGEDW